MACFFFSKFSHILFDRSSFLNFVFNHAAFVCIASGAKISVSSAHIFVSFKKSELVFFGFFISEKLTNGFIACFLKTLMQHRWV